MSYTIDELLACYKATYRLTQMEYGGSIYTYGISYGNRTTLELIEQQKKCIGSTRRTSYRITRNALMLEDRLHNFDDIVFSCFISNDWIQGI